MSERTDRMPQWEKDSLLESLHSDVSRLESQVADLTAKLETIARDTHNELAERVNAQFLEHNKQMHDLRTERAALTRRLEEAHNEIAEKERCIQRIRTEEIAPLNAKLAAVEQERDALLRELMEGKEYLARLWAIVAPQCELLPSLAGIASQYDNYITGLRTDLAQARAALEAILKTWLDSHTHGAIGKCTDMGKLAQHALARRGGAHGV